MRTIPLILSLAALISCGLSPSMFAHAQCLSYKDQDLTFASDIDISGVQDFHVDLFKRLMPLDHTRNLVFSPYSVWNALVLAYFGSEGDTELQLRKVLRVEDKLTTYRKWRKLEYTYNLRPDASINNTFVLSNRIYFDASVALRFCMEDLLHNEVKKLDIQNDPTGSADKINQFVSETTRGHINRLVSPDDIRFARLVLVNAAYFKGNWATTFDPEFTRDEPFTNLNNEEITVPIMSRFGSFNYTYDDTNEFQVVELPYIGNIISMYLFLPYKAGAQNFNKMIDGLTYSNIQTILDKKIETKMHVLLPKFSLETVVEHELMTALFDMGIQSPFMRDQANFFGFSLNRNLYLDHGVHKAFINVNEEGTEAGAATAFIVNKIGGSSMFRCNRPFVFAIRDNETKNFLFMGTYKSPPKSSRSTGSSGPNGGQVPDALTEPNTPSIPQGQNPILPQDDQNPTFPQEQDPSVPQNVHTPIVHQDQKPSTPQGEQQFLLPQQEKQQQFTFEEEPQSFISHEHEETFSSVSHLEPIPVARDGRKG